MSDLTGRALGAYRVEKKIGEGGNSDVYLARDTAHGNEQVALKVLRLEHHADPKKVERFWQSGHNARELNHPHIVRVREAGLADSRYYIAMDYMAGRSVEDVLNEGDGVLTWAAALRYLEQVAGAIDYAHSRGVVHRDIKPSNILLSADRRSACLTDFGIALLTGRVTTTHSGTLVGTPEYISPEQVQGRTADRRSDIYSLGVTAYQMLCGRLPFDGPAVTVLYNHVHTPPPPLRRANPRLPAGLSRPVNKALAKEPERRHASAGDFARDLRRAADGRRSRALWAGVGSVALLVVLLAFVLPRFGASGGGVIPVTRVVTAAPGAIAQGQAPSSLVGGAAPGATAAGATVAGATSTLAPTGRATSTDEPPATAARTTPTPATAAANTRVATATAGAPRPLAPADGAAVARDAAVQTFRWEWNRPLAADESFELRFYPAGGGQFLAPFGWRKESSAEIDLNNLPTGAYRWVVAVVRGADGNWEADVAAGESRDLVWGR